MDRDNTIARLENIAKHAVHTAGEDIFILSLDDGLAIHEAIEALKAQLSPEGTTSDLISKTEVVEHLRRVLDATVPVSDYDEGYVDGVEFGISTVSTMPSVQPEPKKGEWSDGYRWQRCSLCKQTGKKSWNYCPNCGADMRGKKDG